MGITIKKIAELAGVSRGTVDRVIHNRYGVRPEIRDAVMAIIQEMNYTPNKVAQALKRSEIPMTFGLIIMDLSNPFWNVVLHGFQYAQQILEPNGVKLIQKNMKRISAAEQLRCIDELIHGKEKISGLLLPGLENPEIAACINEISREIPVITYNTDISNCSRLCFVGQDHLLAGKIAGKMMSMLMKEDGEIIVYMGPGKTAAHQNRFAGFCESMQQLRPASTVRDPRMDAIKMKNYDQMAYDYLKKELQNPEVRGVYVTGEGVIGAAAALKDSGRRPEVKMVCYDLLPEIIQAVREDIVDVTISQEEFRQGMLSLNLMYEYLAFHEIPKQEDCFTDIDIRMKENIHLGNHWRFENGENYFSIP